MDEGTRQENGLESTMPPKKLCANQTRSGEVDVDEVVLSLSYVGWSKEEESRGRAEKKRENEKKNWKG